MMEAVADVPYVEVLAFGVAVDRDNGFDYQTAEVAASAYTSATVTVRRPVDYVHVNQSGGKQMAAVVYAWLKWWSWH